MNASRYTSVLLLSSICLSAACNDEPDPGLYGEDDAVPADDTDNGSARPDVQPPAPEACIPNETRCADSRHEQRCFDDGRTVKFAAPVACHDGFACEQDGCAPITSECYPAGRRECFPGGTVAECQLTPAGAYLWAIIARCHDAGLAYCDPTSHACRNACGGTSPLAHDPGEPSTSPACGSFVCQPDGSIAPDHVSCSPPGFPCSKASECVTLVCKVGADGQKRCGS